MKKLLFTIFIYSSFIVNAQFHLKWEASTEDLSALKNETVLKLEFNLDSFSINKVSGTVSNRDRYKNADYYTVGNSTNKGHYGETGFEKKENIKRTFEESFNLEGEEKLNAKFSLMTSLYNYTLKIIPQKFYTHTENYISSPESHSVMTCCSFYIKGDYLIECYAKNASTPIASFKLTNLSNKFPMCSNCGKNKYSNDADVEINRNIYRAGTESAKYIMKLIRKSS